MSIVDYPNGSTNANPLVLADGSTQLQVTSGTATQSGVISETGGSFGPEKTGAGTLIYTGANTYTGVTTISAGTLQIGNNGPATNIGYDILDNGVLAFSNLDSLVLGAISGTGSVVILSGDTAFAANASYTGGTTINSGATLEIGGTFGALTGDVVDDGTFVPTRQFDGVISGSGIVHIRPFIGPIVLSGINTYTGATQIDANAYLVVTGSIASSTINLSTSAQLGGTGTVGAITVGSSSALTPGVATGAIGTLSIAGNLNIATGSYVVDLNPGNADKVQVSGTTTIAPESVLSIAVAANVTYAPGVYTLLSSVGNLSGHFSYVNYFYYGNFSSGIVPFISYDAHNVFLTLSQEKTWLSSPGTNLFADTANWANGAAPGSGETAVFSGSSINTIAINGPVTIGGMRFTGGVAQYTFNVAGALTLNNGGINDPFFNLPAFNVANGSSLTFTGFATSGTAHIDVAQGGVLFYSGAADPGGSLIDGPGGVLDIGGIDRTLFGINRLGTIGTVDLGGKTLLVIGGATVSGNIVDNSLSNGSHPSSVRITGGGVRFTGTSTYTGGTIIDSNGTLRLGNYGTTGSIAGNVADDGELSFERSDTITYGGVISGAGRVTQYGGGTTILTAINTYTGTTTVSAGTLLVDGSIASSAVTAWGGGAVGGSGTLGATSVQSGGKLAAGDAPGAISNLHVNGNLTFQAGGALSEDISAAAADQIIVSGSVSLGGQLAANFAGSGYGHQTFTLLHANGGISGAFANIVVTGLPAGLDAHVTYDANNVYLTTEPPPNISIGNASVGEGGVLHFGVTLDQASSQNITLGYDTFAGTASMADNDYLGGTGTLTIQAGQTTGTINVQTVSDSKVEPDETMSVHLLTASFGVLTQAVGTGTIVNVVPPNISIGNASVSEGGVLHFGVTLDAAAAQNITLGYDTFLGTASMADNDYLGGPGTLTILAGQTTGTINLQTVQDFKVEPDETMSVHLLNASFGVLAQATGTGTIVNDDVAPNISIGNASVTEGGVLHFGVSLDQAATQNITLGYDTFLGTASMADNDYLGGPGSLTILAGQTTGTINLQTVQDSKVEPDETMSVHLLNASFGNITQGVGTGTIVNDDVVPNISIGNASVTEGGVLHFGVTLDQAASQNVTLGYDTFLGTASMADNDYLGGPGSLTILAGQTTGTINIQTVQDATVEPDETMSVHLLNASFGNITQAIGTGTIVNDDVAPTPPNISIGDATVTEGDVLHFGVSLDKAASQNITLGYDTFAGSASMADNDYLGGPGSLTILAGQTSGTIDIQTVQDSKFEGIAETMQVHLLTANFGAITQGTGRGAIFDDDALPSASISNASVLEGGLLRFGVSLGRIATQNVTLSYDTFADTASMADNDYLGGPGTLTILAGQSDGFIAIQTVQDSKVEPDETMSVRLLASSYGTIALGTGTGTILNTVTPNVPAITIGNSGAGEGGTLQFSVFLGKAWSQDVTVSYDTFAGTASMADNDYLGGNGTLTILAGQTTGTINILTVQDSKVEPNETMSLHLLSTSFGAITQGIGNGVIFDDDGAPNISIGNASVAEGGVLHFGVTLNQAAQQDIVMGYDTFAGTASMANNDYLGGPGTLTILAGQTTGTINIQTVLDGQVEPDEIMSVQLGGTTFGSIAQGIGVGTILSNSSMTPPFGMPLNSLALAGMS